MYLNTEKGNTNIDNQFDNKNFNFKNIDFSKMKLPLIIAGIVLLIIVAIIIFISFKNKTEYFITLEGAEEISIYQGDSFVEPGYSGRDNKNNDLTSSIIVDNQVDSQTIGTYEIIYKLNNTTKKRIVNVVEKGVGNIFIYLLGDDPIILNVGDTYTEPGYNATDSIDSNITDKVQVTDNIDTTKIGTYQVVYTVTNSSGITTSKARKVIVK